MGNFGFLLTNLLDSAEDDGDDGIVAGVRDISPSLSSLSVDVESAGDAGGENAGE